MSTPEEAVPQGTGFRIGFFGSAPFVSRFLDALYASSHTIAFVATSPDKPKGRGKQFASPEAKLFADSRNIPCIQPLTVRDPAVHEQIAHFSADLFIVIAYGRILPKALLDMTGLGAFNLHFSLLPRWRGAAPVQHAILNGDIESGVTIMKMDEGLDTGDILAQKKIPIGPDTTSLDLFDDLIAAGIPLLLDALDMIGAGRAQYRKQEETGATYASVLRKEDGLIDWTKDAATIHNAVRALQPWPGCYTYLDGRRLKIWKTRIIGQQGTPGRIGETGKDYFLVGTGKHSLSVLELQEEGRNRLSAADFLRGKADIAGKSFDNNG